MAATRISTDRALAVALRAGGTTGLFVETTSVIGVLAAFGIPFATKGGLSLPLEQASSLALHIASLLPAYGLGTAAAALVLQRGAAVYRSASSLGSELAAECRCALDDTDAKNPAIVAELVGGHLGLCASRALDLLLSATVANVASFVIGAAVFHMNLGDVRTATALACLPLVVRAFGVIASTFGVMAVRCDEAHPPANALWWGQASTASLALAGLLGTSVWLLGEQPWGRIVMAGTVGLVAVGVAAHAPRLQLRRRSRSLREVTESLKSGHLATLPQCLAGGLESAALPLVALALAMSAAWALGASTGLVGGGLTATLVTSMVMLATGPYALAVSTFGPIADSARGMAVVGAAPVTTDSQRRATRLTDAGLSASTFGQTYLALVSTLTAWIAATAVLLLRAGASSAPWSATVDLGQPVVLCGGVLGVAVVLAYAGSIARASALGARSVTAEVQRQLGGFTRVQGVPQLPRDFTPSYRACIDVAAQASLQGTLPASSAVLLVPAALGAALAASSSLFEPGTARQVLASFVAISAICGLAAALALDETRGLFLAARRGDRPRSGIPGSSAGAAAEALAGVMGDSAGPAAHLLVKALALGALASAAFLV